MLTPDQMDDLADAIDARCQSLGDDATAWMNAMFLEVLEGVQNAPDWFNAALAELRADWSASEKRLNGLAKKIIDNQMREDGELMTVTIHGREHRIHPFLVLGKAESDRHAMLAQLLQFITYGESWGWDSAEEVYRLAADLEGMAAHTLAVYQRRAKP